MKFKKGFTLIELLVVISIIALLMSIMMPSLQRARKIAKSTICMTNVRSWGMILSMFSNDNDGLFPTGFADSKVTGGSWLVACMPYYDSGNNDIWLCPEATKSTAEGAKNPFSAWFRDKDAPDPTNNYPDGMDILCSYGINQWCYNPSSSVQYDWARRNIGDLSWRGPSRAKNPGDIPLFLDCFQPGGYPTAKDAPPAYDGALNYGANGRNNNMCYFAINRHVGTNVVFVDMSVKKVSIKNMWDYSWHRNYDKTEAPLPEEMPLWIRNLPD